MPYQPKLEDLNQASYQPSLEDVPKQSSENPFNSIMTRIGSMLPEQRMPLGMDVASGLLSLGVPQGQREIIRDLPQIASGQQPNTSEKIAQGVGEYLPLSLTGMGSWPGITGMAARINGTGAYGAALNPKNRIQGLSEGMKMGALGEALPLGLHAIGSLAETINPKRFTNQMGDIIKHTYQTFKDQAHSTYESLKNKYADSNIYNYSGDKPSLNYSNMGEDLTEYYGPTLKKMHSKFMENPSYKNAQDLQSQMASYIRTINSGKKDTYTQNAIESISDARNKLNDDLLSFLMKSDKNDFNEYSKARDITRDILSPHENNPVINKIVKGRSDQLQPNELFNALKKMTETGKLPENHYMQKIKQGLGSKITRGNLINNIASLGAGAGIGELLMPGAGGIGSGLTAGGLAAKFLSPVAVEIAQNPYFLKTLEKLKAPYNTIKGGIIGNQLQEK